MNSKMCWKFWCLGSTPIFPFGFASRPAGKLSAQGPYLGPFQFLALFLYCLLISRRQTNNTGMLGGCSSRRCQQNPKISHASTSSLILTTGKFIIITQSDHHNSRCKSPSSNFCIKTIFPFSAENDILKEIQAWFKALAWSSAHLISFFQKAAPYKHSNPKSVLWQDNSCIHSTAI